jgi:hypothetical protein
MLRSFDGDPAQVAEFVDHGLAAEGIWASSATTRSPGIERSHPVKLAVGSLQVRRIKIPSWTMLVGSEIVAHARP